MHCTPMRRTRRRPPVPTRTLSCTWHKVARSAAGAECRTEVAAVGGALLASEARRRGSMVSRERVALKTSLCPRHRRRVLALESELARILEAVERYKRLALSTVDVARAA